MRNIALVRQHKDPSVALRWLARHHLLIAGALGIAAAASGQGRHPDLPSLWPANSVRAVRRQLEVPAKHDQELREPRDKRHGRKPQAGHAPGKNHTVTVTRRSEHESSDSPDWLQAYLFYLEQRAYPRDSMDLLALARAAEHRDRMPQAEALGKPPLDTDRLTGKWEFIGPRKLDPPNRIYEGIGYISGRVNAVAFDPVTAGTYYISAAGGGLWKTADAGATWKCLSDSWKVQQAGSIAIDPTNPQTIYVATGDSYFNGAFQTRFLGDGINKSTDGGETWSLMGKGIFGHVGISKILLDPANPGTLVVATGTLDESHTGKIWRSTDGAVTWEAVTGAPRACWTNVVAGTPNAFGTRSLYACGFIPNGVSVLYRSTDSGVTWVKRNPPISASPPPKGFDVAASAIDSATLYCITGYKQRIFKSADAGKSWLEITNNFPNGANDYNWSQAWYDYFIGCSQGKTPMGAATDVLYVGLIDVAQSADGGKNWTSIGGPTYTNVALTHNDQHAWAVDPHDPNTMLVGNDGGVYLLQYDPSTEVSTFTSLNADLGITQFYHLAVDTVNADTLLGGTQDNASPAALGATNKWQAKVSGDGGWTAIDPAGNGTQYATAYVSGQEIFFEYTTDNWAHRHPVDFAGFPKDSIPFLCPTVLDPSDSKRLYIGTNELYKWTIWHPDTLFGPLSGLLSSRYLLTIAVSCDGDALYTGALDGKIYANYDRTGIFTDISAGAPHLAVTSIAVNPRNRLSILAGFSGSGSPHLWMCPNTKHPAWVSVSGSGSTGLPDIALNAIALDPNDPDHTWYVATDAGCMQTTNAGATWQNITRSLRLPNVQVNDLKVDPGGGFLYAATFGRGIWRIPLSPTTAYTITDIPMFQPTSWGSNFPTALSNCGTVVGFISDASGNYTYEWPDPNGSLIDLTGSSANPYTDAVGINCAGEVVGVTGPGDVGWLYSMGTYTSLTKLFEADSINSAGQIAGFDASDKLAVWTPLSLNGSAGTVVELPGDDSNAAPASINDAGNVASFDDSNDAGLLLFVRSGAQYTRIDLGSVQGMSVYAAALLNAEGQIALSLADSRDNPHPYVWIPTRPNGTTGAFVALPDLGFGAEVSGINKYGRMCGTASDGTGKYRAVAWAPAGGGAYTLIDLNTVLPSGSGWTLQNATAINDHGQIAGTGMNPQGYQDGFLLTPR